MKDIDMYKTHQFIYNIIFITALFISACSSSLTPTVTNITATEKPSTPIPPITSTSTPIIENTPTVTPLPLPEIKIQCMDDVTKSQELGLQGVIVLKQTNKYFNFQIAEATNSIPDGDFGFYFLNPDNKQIIKTINEGLLEQVSPNGKYFAYSHYDSSGDKVFLGILDSNGNVVNDFSLFLNGAWQSYYNWQNSKQIRMVAAYDTVEVRILDPFTKSHSHLQNDWDSAYTPNNPYTDKVANWKFDIKATRTFDVYGANILYDPSLTHVVYPKDDGFVSLVNVESEEEIASAQFNDWGRIPSWSPNGEYLMILNHEGTADEFYIITKDGDEFQRITNFAKEVGNTIISEYTWSPDSTQIAFWLNTGQDEVAEGEQSELAILDIATKQVTRLCIQGISTNAQKPYSMFHPEPIWSPDGKYILFTQWNKPENPTHFYVLVVDPSTGALENISVNTAPIGWMVRDQ